MTTIAYKDGVMASDSRLTNGSRIFPGECVKCFFTEGALVGTVGDAAEMFIDNPIFHTLKNPKQLQAWLTELECDDNDWGLLVVFFDKPNKVYIADITAEGDTSKSGYFHVNLAKGEGIARGSGDVFAVSAMAMGSSAAEAVEFAMEFDAATGGTVTEYFINAEAE